MMVAKGNWQPVTGAALGPSGCGHDECRGRGGSAGSCPLRRRHGVRPSGGAVPWRTACPLLPDARVAPRRRRRAPRDVAGGLEGSRWVRGPQHSAGPGSTGLRRTRRCGWPADDPPGCCPSTTARPPPTRTSSANRSWSRSGSSHIPTHSWARLARPTRRRGTTYARASRSRSWLRFSTSRRGSGRCSSCATSWGSQRPRWRSSSK